MKKIWRELIKETEELVSLQIRGLFEEEPCEEVYQIRILGRLDDRRRAAFAGTPCVKKRVVHIPDVDGRLSLGHHRSRSHQESTLSGLSNQYSSSRGLMSDSMILPYHSRSRAPESEFEVSRVGELQKIE